MTGIIHMQTEETLRVAAQLRRTSDDAFQQASMLLSLVQSIDWLGYDRDEYVARFEQLARAMAAAAEDGASLSQRVAREVEQWLLVDSTFGDRGLPVGAGMGAIAGGTAGGYLPGSGGVHPLNNMQDLAWWVMKRDNPEPIEIVNIGNGEFLVLVRGTTTDPDNMGAGNNWGSALTTGLGLPGDYQLALRKAISEHVPPGATLHFAGHSQGGIVSNNLADDQDLRDRYNIASVTTFGAPANTYEHDGTKYTHYAALADAVPALGLVPLTSLMRQNYIDGKDYGGLFNPHGSYPNAPALQNDGLPFTVNQWNNNWDGGGPHVFDSGANSSLALVNANLFSGDPLKIGAGLLDVGDQINRNLLVGGTSYAVNEVAGLFGSDVRNAVDRYTDRINRQIMEFPTTSQQLEMAYDAGHYVVDKAGEAIVDAGGAIVDGAGKVGGAIGGGLESAGSFVGSFF